MTCGRENWKTVEVVCRIKDCRFPWNRPLPTDSSPLYVRRRLHRGWVGSCIPWQQSSLFPAKILSEGNLRRSHFFPTICSFSTTQSTIESELLVTLNHAVAWRDGVDTGLCAASTRAFAGHYRRARSRRSPPRCSSSGSDKHPWKYGTLWPLPMTMSSSPRQIGTICCDKTIDTRQITEIRPDCTHPADYRISFWADLHELCKRFVITDSR
jgi:hypothetical protein